MINLALMVMFVVGWLVAYFFYRRHKSASEKLYEKMVMDARKFILDDKREKLGLADIIDLFHEKIIDEHLDLLDEPFPYKRCPKCGSKKARRFVIKNDGTLDIQGAPETPPIAGEEFRIICRRCGYKDEVVTNAKEGMDKSADEY